MNIKDKKKNFINIILLLISLIIVVVLCVFLLDTTGKINQGSFRVNDLVVFSIATVEDTKENTDITTETDESVVHDSINSISDLRLDISQKNVVSFLITKLDNIDATDIYIDNVKTKYPILTENMYIYQKEENKIDLKTENIKLFLDKEDKDGQYLIKVNIDNINCVKEVAIPETETSIIFDGTIFNVFNTKISDITFDIQFNLNITDSNGRINICKVKLYMPNELLVTNGVSIIKEDTGKFSFTIK
ncbi:MAG: hypothetical protein PHD15_00290 [Clostridia bacterium]|nr:hypothetical protein [Clostridia bacterium]MDD4386190.1 hypothetical protein [Clostridia bacterium]